jgi:hypothetical protein
MTNQIILAITRQFLLRRHMKTPQQFFNSEILKSSLDPRDSLAGTLFRMHRRCTCKKGPQLSIVFKLVETGIVQRDIKSQNQSSRSKSFVQFILNNTSMFWLFRDVQDLSRLCYFCSFIMFFTCAKGCFKSGAKESTTDDELTQRRCKKMDDLSTKLTNSRWLVLRRVVVWQMVFQLSV